MYLVFRSEDSEIFKVLANNPHQNDDGYFNATTFAAVEDNDENIESYLCVVNFDGYPKNLTTSITSGTGKVYIYLRILYLCILLRHLLSFSIFNI